MRGIYCLLISVKKDSAIRVGALGRMLFKKGTYCYVGSAQNGLEARVNRHLSSKKKKRFWHIDYLLADRKNAFVRSVFYKIAGKKTECETAGKLAKAGGAPMSGFGCSDCSCHSHLFFLSPGTSRSLRARSRMPGWRGLSGKRNPSQTRLSRSR